MTFGAVTRPRLLVPRTLDLLTPRVPHVFTYRLPLSQDNSFTFSHFHVHSSQLSTSTFATRRNLGTDSGCIKSLASRSIRESISPGSLPFYSACFSLLFRVRSTIKTPG